MGMTELQRILVQLEAIVEDEKTYLHSLDVARNPHSMFYTVLANRAKHDIRWAGIRTIKELYEIVMDIANNKTIHIASGELITDTDHPGIMFSLLTRITQSLYHQFDTDIWNAAIDTFVDKIIFGFNDIDKTLAFGYDSMRMIGNDDCFTPDDVKSHVDKKEVFQVLVNIPFLATLAFMSLLPNSVLFMSSESNNETGG